MAAEAQAAGRDRHDPVVHLWGLLVVMESRLRVDPGDPTIAEWLEGAEQLLRQQVGRIDAVRAQVAAARFHLAGGRPTEAWRATAAAGLRRLRRYARTFPMARPRALACLGWSHWLHGRQGAAHRAWTRAIGEAERLAMPLELANAHHQLGRHLAAGERSPLGLDPTEHLDRARSTFEALGTSAQGQGP